MKTKTVSELAELFGVTRQAMNKRVKSLDTKFVEKNEKNVTVVNAEGIHELEGLYGKVVTA
ncbi:MarR family transcriptional regulator, partial [Lactococcus lactis]